ncbi:MAG: hypothetical protein EBR28_01430 [Planctomycetia bacterium]|nr:hypothetical protein [Planctomycetia bacterium]
MALARDIKQGTARRVVAVSPDDGSAIDLRNPAVAALLSWAVPGLGQIYQGRVFKGRLFMGAILGTFLAGLWLGGGKVVYASWKPGDTRWPFVCQAGAGLVAVPALVQSFQLHGVARQPLFASPFMAPPLVSGQYVSRGYAERLAASDPDIDDEDFFDRPPLKQFRGEQVSLWHRRLGRWFDIGTLYTMLAGMLNVLVIYDAFAGPLGTPTDEDRKTRSAPSS